MKIMMKKSWKQTDIRRESYAESKYCNSEIAFIRQHSAAKIYENWWNKSKNTVIFFLNCQLFFSCRQKQKKSCKQQQVLKVKQKCSENSFFHQNHKLISATWKTTVIYSRSNQYWELIRQMSFRHEAEYTTQHLTWTAYSTAFWKSWAYYLQK